MIYQHATKDRDQVIAKALGGLARQAQANTAGEGNRTLMTSLEG